MANVYVQEVSMMMLPIFNAFHVSKRILFVSNVQTKTMGLL